MATKPVEISADAATTEQGVSGGGIDQTVKHRPPAHPPGGWNPTGRQAAVAKGMTMLEVSIPRLVPKLIELAEGGQTEAIRLAATREIFDRVFGKPKQSMDVQVTDISKLHLQVMQEIQARREERMRTIEGDTERGAGNAPQNTSKSGPASDET